MATEIASLYARVGADISAFQREMGKAKGEMSAFEKTNNAVGNTLKLAAGVGVAAVAGLGKGIYDATQQAADMEQQMANIAAVMGKSRDEIAPLNDLVMQLGINPQLKVSAVEAAQAIEMLAKNGLSMDEIMNGAAESTVRLANSTGADFATAADIATDAMSMFNIDAADMMKAVDGITGVTVSSKFDIDDYRLALAQAGGVASSVGVDFDDFNAVIADISPSFASGSDAGTSFKTFLQRLVPQSGPARDAMQELGIITTDYTAAAEALSKMIGKEVAPNLQAITEEFTDYASEQGIALEGTDKMQNKFEEFLLAFDTNAFFDTNGQLRDMSEVAGVLEGAFAGLSEEQKIAAASTIFGTDAMRAAFELAKGGAGDIDRLREAIGNTDAIDSSTTRMDTFRGAMEILQGIIETLTISIGMAFLPAFRNIVEAIAGFLESNGATIVDWFGRLADAIAQAPGKIAELIAKIQEWWGGVQPIVQPFIDFVGEWVSWGDVITALGILIGTFVATTLAGLIASIAPVVAVVGGLVMAVAAVRTAWENDWGGIQTKTMEAKDYLVSRFGELGSAVQKFGGDALHEIGLWLNGQETDFAAAKEIWGTARDAFGQVWEDVKGVLSAWGDKITEWAGVAWSAFAEKFPNAAATLQGAWDRTKETVQRFWDTVKPLLDKAIEWIKKTADEWKIGSENMSGVMENAKIAIDAILSIIFTSLETFINNAIDTITLLIQFFSGDFEGAWETAKGIVERTLNAWKTIAETALNALLDVFGLNLDDLKEIVGDYFEQGKKIVSNLWDGMKSVWNSLEDWFGRAFDALPEPVQDLLRSVYNWGRDIVQGIWNGVRDRWNDFTNWFRSAWENIKGSFTSFFRIGSPSKLFAEYGGNIAEGLAIGMERAMPQVDAAVMGMAGTVDGTGSMMGPGPMDNGDSDLAAAIRALIAVLQQQRGGNQISVTMPQASGNSRSDLAATVQYLQALYA